MTEPEVRRLVQLLVARDLHAALFPVRLLGRPLTSEQEANRQRAEQLRQAIEDRLVELVEPPR